MLACVVRSFSQVQLGLSARYSSYMLDLLLLDDLNYAICNMEVDSSSVVSPVEI